jgi:hypothetical protein
MLNVIMLSVVVLNVDKLSVVTVSVAMLNVVALKDPLEDSHCFLRELK